MSAVQVGARVHAKGTLAADGTITLSRLEVQNAHEGNDANANTKAEGTVTALDAGSLTVTPSEGGAPVTFTVPAGLRPLRGRGRRHRRGEGRRERGRLGDAGTARREGHRRPGQLGDQGSSSSGEQGSAGSQGSAGTGDQGGSSSDGSGSTDSGSASTGSGSTGAPHISGGGDD